MKAATHLDWPFRSSQPYSNAFRIAVFLTVILLALFHASFYNRKLVHTPANASDILEKCRILNEKPRPPDDFHQRRVSDRFEQGTAPVLIRNATIWTGRYNGTEVTRGDILLSKGIIKAFGTVPLRVLNDFKAKKLNVIDANGSWVTPGIIDMHSHIGVSPWPVLDGTVDNNSLKGVVQPWLRAIDALHTHDMSFQTSNAGGVLTSLLLPGSANGIGGEAIVVKHRPTSAKTSTAMTLEPPFASNGSRLDLSTHRWRHIKHACGENPARVYSGTRMDTVWAQRQAYETAATIKLKQDRYCEKAERGAWDDLNDTSFPEDMKWEALVDVLRGKAKAHVHCYTSVDLDGFVRLSNEFKFRIAAFHHAHEAYLVPDLLKRAYKGPPALAMFGSFARYKAEAYRHSGFGPKILNDNGLKVIMKSDNPGISSRYVLHEAQQAFYYGLPANVALSSVISTPAEVLGLNHRIGFVEEGYDADLVIWDSYPLQLGATPLEVIVDGIPQLPKPQVTEKKLPKFQDIPVTPDFREDAQAAVDFDGLPPLSPKRRSKDIVVFRNVSEVYHETEDGRLVQRKLVAPAIVAVQGGEIVCLSTQCLQSYSEPKSTIDLKGGSITPGLVSHGTSLGLQEIATEMSTTDGAAPNYLSKELPSVVGSELIRAVDGLMFGTRNALLGYRSGVVTGITAPAFSGGFDPPGFSFGLATAFTLGALNTVERGAIAQDATAIHVNIAANVAQPSVSTQVAALRNLLLSADQSPASAWTKVLEGDIRLVVNAHSADLIATLIRLKAEIQKSTGKTIKMTIYGGTEAHLVADSLADSDIGIIVSPPRSIPVYWGSTRFLAGPPLTNDTLVAVLVKAGVTVGLGPQGNMQEFSLSNSAVPNFRWEAAWMQMLNQGVVSEIDALEIASSNLEKLLGLNKSLHYKRDLVATAGGGLLDFESKVVGVISESRGLVDLF